MDENENNMHEDEELDNIIVLNDENGEEVPFEFLDLIDLDDEEYVVLLPADDTEDEGAGEVVILKVEDSEDGSDLESYVSVDNEETLKSRLNEYHANTAPLIHYYSEEKMIHSVDGTKDLDELMKDLNAIIG